MSEQSLPASEPRWRRPEVVAVRLVTPEYVMPAPAPRFCTEPGCGKRLSQLNPAAQCYTHQPRRIAYSRPKAQRREVDRA